jgi:predicted membrane-bound mannosyltransferase
MKMQTKFSLDQLLLLAAFLLALVFRFLKLGQSPLPDAEAELALQAMRLADGSGRVVSGQPGYILPTAVAFRDLALAAVARLIPALAGAFLTLIPGFYRKELGTGAAVVLSFCDRPGSRLNLSLDRRQD